MTMGLPCDSDGYDLRTEQCRQCGSRGCPRKHRCKVPDNRFPPGWLRKRLAELVELRCLALDSRVSNEAIGIRIRNTIAADQQAAQEKL